MGRIVVGIDGSEGSRAALRWAREEAKLRDWELEVVNGFPYPFYGGFPEAAVPLPLDDDLRAGARSLVDLVLTEEFGSLPSEDEVKRTVAQGPAADILCRAAEGADLLVVGSRGRGGFKELLLGSVSHQCAHHAPCPVLIVRGGERH